MRQDGMGRHLLRVGLLLLSLSLFGTATATPTANFTAARLEGSSGITVVLDAADSYDPGGAIISYQWLFGDGYTGSGIRVEHAYSHLMAYQITLLVTGGSGTSQMATKTIDLADLDGAEAYATASALPTTSAAPSSVPPPRLDLPVGSRTGNRAPAFSLPTFGDEFVRLSDHLGRVVVLEFWRSTCSACLESTPHLEALRQRYAADGLAVILIVLDRIPAAGKRYLDQNGFTQFITLHEVDPNARETTYAYAVSGVPRVFLIDRQGVIRYAGHPNGLSPEKITPWL